MDRYSFSITFYYSFSGDFPVCMEDYLTQLTSIYNTFIAENPNCSGGDLGVTILSSESSPQIQSLDSEPELVRIMNFSVK